MIETGEKSLLNNKSRMNMLFMIVIDERELLQELQIETDDRSVCTSL